MEWNSNLSTFVSRPETSFNFFSNYNYDQFAGIDQMSHPMTMAEVQHGLGHLPAAVGKIGRSYGYNNLEKKKRLTNDQLELLERSFQEEIKLDPDRKMRLSRELGLQPRQIAVWFQNRRARWKAKQLEQLYESLRQEYDAISREKERLQEEVMRLQAILKEKGLSKKEILAAYPDVSTEETVESTSGGICSSAKAQRAEQSQMVEGNCTFNIAEYNSAAVPSSYWAGLPSYQ